MMLTHYECLLALALLAAGLAPLPARAQESAGTLRLRPAAVTVGVGESATVDVWLEGAASYYGVELRLQADPALVAVQVAPAWGVVDAASHIVVKREAGWCDDQSGQRWYGAWYAAASVSPAPAFSGSGCVCAVTLTGLSPGTGSLRIVSARGGTDTGGALHPATAGATLVVLPLTATPSATPTPSASPTPARLSTAAPAALATLPTAAPPPASDTPRPRLAGATPTPTAAAAAPGARPTLTAPVAPARTAAADRRRPLLALLVPFLAGVTLTAAALRLGRRR